MTQITANVITSFYSQSASGCSNRGHVWNSNGEEEPFDQVSSIVSSRPEKGFLSLLSFTVHSTPTGIAKGCKWSSAVNSIQGNFSSSSDWLCFGKKRRNKSEFLLTIVVFVLVESGPNLPWKFHWLGSSWKKEQVSWSEILSCFVLLTSSNCIFDRHLNNCLCVTSVELELKSGVIVDRWGAGWQ